MIYTCNYKEQEQVCVAHAATQKLYEGNFVCPENIEISDDSE